MSIDFNPFAARGSRTPCPECGRIGTMTLSEEFRVLPIGTYSLAGAQPKASAVKDTRITCGGEGEQFIEGCGWNALGEVREGKFVVTMLVRKENSD